MIEDKYADQVADAVREAKEFVNLHIQEERQKEDSSKEGLIISG